MTQMRIKALIVDDEHSGRASLKILLQKDFGNLFEQIDAASTLQEAIKKISESIYNIVFLDIELKSHSGFELLSYLNPHTKVIFVTAYSEYAIKAIKEHAFDYLMKPLDPIELRACISRYQKEDGGNGRNHKYLMIKEAGFTTPIRLDEIEYLLARGPYSQIFTIKQRDYTTSKTLKVLMDMLGKDFIRIHKSYIVNKQMIKSFKKESLTTTHNSCLPVSRVGAKILSQHF